MLYLEIALPSRSPTSGVKMQFYQHNEMIRKISVQHGQHGLLSILFSALGGFFNIDIILIFVQAMTGTADDRRELSAKFLKCDIVSHEEQRTSLFSERSPE